MGIIRKVGGNIKMARRAHILKPTKGSSIPTHIIVFDTETRSIQVDDNTVEARFAFGVYSYIRRLGNGQWSQSRTETFTDVDTFWNSVTGHCKKKRVVYVFAHNLGFDLTVTQALDWFQDNGWAIKRKLIPPGPLALTYEKDGCIITLIDSLNIFPMSLAAVGDFIGYPKQEMPDGEPEGDDWVRYCENDVYVLTEALKAWWALLVDQELGSFTVTLASQAFMAYRHRFMPHPWYIDAIEDSHLVSRAAYMGGRNECFYIGKVPEKVYCLDINSMYPFVMKTSKFPVKLVQSRKKIPVSDLKYYVENYAVVAQVTVDTPDPVYALRHGNRCMFPIGKFGCALTTPDILYGLEHDHIKEVNEIYVYEKREIFKDYVDFFWDLRVKAIERGDTSSAWLSKMLLNSLYGKAGQKSQAWEEVGRDDTNTIEYDRYFDAASRKWIPTRKFGGVSEEMTGEGESTNSFPAIAAHVTAQARQYLWSLIIRAGRENVFYCDTDSLFVNSDGYDNLKDLINPYQLGALKLEWESDDVVLNGLKDYTVDDYRKAKGIRKDAIEIRPGVFKQVQFRNLAGMLRANDHNRQLIKTVEKTLQRDYQKGIVDSAGIVHPLQLLQ